MGKIRTYLSQVLDGMAKGLFASLIIGTIIEQVGKYLGFSYVMQLGQFAKYMMGPCIGVGIATKRDAKQYALAAAAVAGLIGAGAVTVSDAGAAISIGEPAGAFIAALAAVEIGKLIEGRTKFDLLLVPAGVILVGGLVGLYISPVISAFMKELGVVVNELTTLHPLPMGILVSVVVGIVLTLPISSAALCVSISISGLAAGAAVAGCSAHMIGFAVMSFRENGFSGLISQGVGTSMIQIPNLIKNPLCWLPPVIASAITGPLSTMLFKLESNSVGAGMGTSGLVGQLATYEVMGASSLLPMAILHFILPALISLIICEFMRSRGLIKAGDLKL